LGLSEQKVITLPINRNAFSNRLSNRLSTFRHEERYSRKRPQMICGIIVCPFCKITQHTSTSMNVIKVKYDDNKSYFSCKECSLTLFWDVYCHLCDDFLLQTHEKFVWSHCETCHHFYCGSCVEWEYCTSCERYCFVCCGNLCGNCEKWLCKDCAEDILCLCCSDKEEEKEKKKKDKEELNLVREDVREERERTWEWKEEGKEEEEWVWGKEGEEGEWVWRNKTGVLEEGEWVWVRKMGNRVRETNLGWVQRKKWENCEDLEWDLEEEQEWDENEDTGGE